MRTALTLQRLHGEEDFSVVMGPEVPLDEQLREVKALQGGGKQHPEIAEVQLWTSDQGATKKVKFLEPAGAPKKARGGRKSAPAN